jgi:predicted nucleic acid-binding protein
VKVVIDTNVFASGVIVLKDKELLGLGKPSGVEL